MTRLRHRLEKDPSKRHYTDPAITSLDHELDEDLALYEASEGARIESASTPRVGVAQMEMISQCLRGERRASVGEMVVASQVDL